MRTSTHYIIAVMAVVLKLCNTIVPFTLISEADCVDQVIKTPYSSL